MVESITWWDFADGSWLGAPSGFIARDNRVKPVYNEIHKLIKDEWWLKPLHLVTGENGVIDITGCFGEYEVSFGGKASSFMLNRSKEMVTIVISTSFGV